MSTTHVVGSEEAETLPLTGYNRLALRRWIERQLGQPIWNVELNPQHILDSIQMALGLLSKWRPKPKYGSVKLTAGVTRYLVGEDVGAQGVVSVNFVDSIPTPTEIFYGNLISPAPLIRTGLDEYDSFLRWRTTWQRVTSVMPDWMYDVHGKVLFIHNPIERFHAGVVAFDNFKDTTELTQLADADFVRDYALARSTYLYGDILNKYSGAIPGPSKDIQLDQGKREEGRRKMEELETWVRGSQYLTSLTLD